MSCLETRPVESLISLLSTPSWHVSPTDGGPAVVAAQRQLRVLLAPPPSEGALGALAELLTTASPAASRPAVLMVLGQAAAAGSVCDFRKALDCVPEQARGPRLPRRAPLPVLPLGALHGMHGRRSACSQGTPASGGIPSGAHSFRRRCPPEAPRFGAPLPSLAPREQAISPALYDGALRVAAYR